MRKLSLLLVLLASLWLGRVVQAQEPISQQPAHTAEIQELQAVYRQYLLDYQEKERVFLIAKASWQQLDTLASLNQAIVATREMMQSRDTVYLSYYQLLRLQLEDSFYINTTLKQQLIKETDISLDLITKHRQQVEQATTKEELDLAADGFVTLLADIQRVSWLSQSLLKIGKLQGVRDKSVDLMSSITTELEAGDAQLTVTTRNNLAEINDLLTETNQQLKAAQTRSLTDLQEINAGDVDAVSDALQPVYGSLARVNNFMSEIITQYQL